MRPANGVEVYRDASGAPWGVTLVAAPCAEHEGGIPGLWKALGIGPASGAVGLPARTMTRVPDESLASRSSGDVAPVAARVRGRRVASAPDPVPWVTLSVARHGPRLRGTPHPHDVAAASGADRSGLAADWDADGFDVRGCGATAAALVATLADALAANDIAAWVNRPSRLSERAGLVLAVASRVPTAVADLLRESDDDALRLEEAVRASGIVGRVRAAKGGAFWLSPSWRKGRCWIPPMDTAHEVAFWLSEGDRGTCVPGWYSVEQLDEWVAGRGPAHVDGAVPGKVARLLSDLEALGRGLDRRAGGAAPREPGYPLGPRKVEATIEALSSPMASATPQTSQGP